MPSTAEELVAIREKCESYGLRLSAVEVRASDKERSEQFDVFVGWVLARLRASLFSWSSARLAL